MRSLSAAKVHFDSDRLGGKRSTRSPTILPPIHTLAANEDRLDRQFEPWLIRCTRRQTSKVDRRQFDPWALGGKSDTVRASNRRIFTESLAAAKVHCEHCGLWSPTIRSLAAKVQVLSPALGSLAAKVKSSLVHFDRQQFHHHNVIIIIWTWTPAKRSSKVQLDR